jgi:hypothetical protein
MMSFPFVQALDAEIALLTAELASDPRVVKLRELERVRELYGSDGGDSGISHAGNGAPPRPQSSKGSAGRRPAARTKQALEVAEAFLRNRKRGFFAAEPTTTAIILDRLQEAGVEIVGKDPRNSLSALLSHSGRFRSHGRAGWTLAEDEIGPAQNTETADHPLRNGSAVSAEPRSTSEGTTVRPVDPQPGGGT